MFVCVNTEMMSGGPFGWFDMWFSTQQHNSIAQPAASDQTALAANRFIHWLLKCNWSSENMQPQKAQFFVQPPAANKQENTAITQQVHSSPRCGAKCPEAGGQIKSSQSIFNCQADATAGKNITRKISILTNFDYCLEIDFQIVGHALVRCSVSKPFLLKNNGKKLLTEWCSYFPSYFWLFWLLQQLMNTNSIKINKQPPCLFLADQLVLLPGVFQDVRISQNETVQAVASRIPGDVAFVTLQFHTQYHNATLSYNRVSSTNDVAISNKDINAFLDGADLSTWRFSMTYILCTTSIQSSMLTGSIFHRRDFRERLVLVFLDSFPPLTSPAGHKWMNCWHHDALLFFSHSAGKAHCVWTWTSMLEYVRCKIVQQMRDMFGNEWK